MESSKLSVKFYLDDSTPLKLADVVPVFHSWIQFHSIPNHLLIDVADYAHVPAGPGILLVSHEANIYLDDFDGKRGLSYQRKTPIEGTLADRLTIVFRTALEAAQLLQENATLGGANGGVKFRTDEASFKINDRFYAPNTAETFGAVRPELEKFLRTLYGPEVTLEHRADPKRLFEVTIRSSSSPDIAALLKRSGAQPAKV